MPRPIQIEFPTESTELLPDRFRRWFAARGWAPREHQLELLAKARDDRSALLIAPTGAGKTLAGFLPTLVELSAHARAAPSSPMRPSPLPPRGVSRVAGREPAPDLIRGRGWGVPQQTLCQRSKLIDPPPPTPPRHAQRRVEGGEMSGASSRNNSRGASLAGRLVTPKIVTKLHSSFIKT